MSIEDVREVTVFRRVVRASRPALGVLLLGAAGFLAACGGGDQPPGQSAVAAEATGGPAAAPAGPAP
jgi:hypothetical protein